MSCCADPSCRNGSLCNPRPGCDDREAVYIMRAWSYGAAAEALEGIGYDEQVRATLETIAAELRDTAERWRKMTPTT